MASFKASLVATIALLAGAVHFSRARADVLYTYTGPYGDFTYLYPTFRAYGEISLDELRTNSFNPSYDIVAVAFDDPGIGGGDTQISFLTPPCPNDACLYADFAGGVLTNLGSYTANYDTGDGVSKLVVSEFTPGVPEPSTWALMGLGFAALGLLARRRQSSAATAG